MSLAAVCTVWSDCLGAGPGDKDRALGVGVQLPLPH